MVVPVLGGEIVDLGDRVVGAPVGTKPIRGRQEVRLENWFEHQFQASLNHPVSDNRDGYFILPLLQSCVGIFPSGVDCAGEPWLRDIVPGGTDVLARSGSDAGLGASGCGVEVPGFGDAATAVDLGLFGPGDAESVAGSAACGELAGLDPVVDDAGAAAEPGGGVGDADLCIGVGVRGGDAVGVPDPLDGRDVERAPVAGGQPGGVEL